MTQRISLVKDDVVVNVVSVPDDWTGAEPDEWQVPEGLTVVVDDDAQLGATRKPDGTWSAPERPTRGPSLERRVAELEARVAALEGA